METQPPSEKREKLTLITDENDPSFLKSNKWMKIFRENLSLITILILFFSLAKLHAYYSYYHVDIINFIGIQELVAPIINDLVSYILIIIEFLLYGYFAAYMEREINKQVKKKKDIRGYFFSKYKIIDYPIFFIITILVYMLPIGAALFVSYKTTSFVNFYFLGYLYFAFAVIIVLFIMFAKVFKVRFHQIHFFTVIPILVFGISSIYDGRLKAEYFYDHRDDHNSYVIFEGDSVNSCYYNYWLIGLTDDYAIFWNEKIVNPEIRRRSEIKMIRPGVLPIRSMTVFGFNFKPQKKK